ncbi:hypothetical protein ACP70R_005087 [Stipagrostis hirtigluma subsp. patula]
MAAWGTMWACRRFLSQPRARALLSHLHPIAGRRATDEPPLVLGGASLTAPRRHVSDASDGDCREYARSPPVGANGDHSASDTTPDGRPANLPPAAGKKKHLYLVLDDKADWFGIHRLDIDHADDASGGAVADSAEPGTPERLPEPPVMRVESCMTLGAHPWFAGVGSNIIGLGSGTPNYRYMSFEERDGVTLAFDTKTAALTVLRDLPFAIAADYPQLGVTAGNRLYVIESASRIEPRTKHLDRFCEGAMHCLKLQEADAGGGEDVDGGKFDPWTWAWYDSGGSWRPPLCWSVDHRHRWLPLSPKGIRSHAVHPGGRVFFVSVHCGEVADHRGRGTFSYDTARDRWTRHGDWELPFFGQAHYDGELEAWVGLHARRGDDDGSFERDGYLCSCDVPALGVHGDDVPAPEWKLGREKVFFEDPTRHVDVKLVSMGGGGRFCLVEILTREGGVGKEGCLGDGDKCVLRLTTFLVRYGDDGELTVTSRRLAGLYKLSRYEAKFDVQAFWM